MGVSRSWLQLRATTTTHLVFVDLFIRQVELSVLPYQGCRSSRYSTLYTHTDI